MRFITKKRIHFNCLFFFNFQLTILLALAIISLTLCIAECKRKKLERVVWVRKLNVFYSPSSAIERKKRGGGGEKNATILWDLQKLYLLVYINTPNVWFKITLIKMYFVKMNLLIDPSCKAGKMRNKNQCYELITSLNS